MATDAKRKGLPGDIAPSGMTLDASASEREEHRLHSTRQKELQARTMSFAVRVIRLCRKLSATPGEGWVVRDQLLRCGTAVAANYRAACRARSKVEFAAKLGIVVEEADETIFWLELLVAAGTMAPGKLRALMDEARQLLHIFAAARKTTLNHVRQQ